MVMMGGLDRVRGAGGLVMGCGFARGQGAKGWFDE